MSRPRRSLTVAPCFRARGNVTLCHPSTVGPYAAKALFTDYTYDNLGIPKNPNIPGGPDLGLGAIVNDVLQNGKFKVPTLRNIAVAPPYGHNGYFKSLKEIVTSTTPVTSPSLPVTGHAAPEVSPELNTAEMGNLGLTDAEENDIVAFLATLTDGYFCK